MDKPATSKYDRHPFDPNDHSDDSAVPPNLGNTDSPVLKVAWASRPSFNTDPTFSQDGGDSAGSPPAPDGDAKDFSVNFGKLGDGVNKMLTTAGGLVTQYENLRSHVLSSEGTVFGQTSTVTAASDTYDAGSHTWTHHDNTTGPTVFAKPAQEFAAQMNPAQEKTLQAIGAALELFGEYIALVNHSGQVYAAADRHSLFPAPPTKGVTG
ncbi:hypothetical protein NE235_35560 [Actinoallomurus spadix]|uniref:Uncharacterized protein n=1 Tax=Actinoallomurus spadix TaxID=79912 RepID=A0ABN0XRB2_9ACTN|nr:hypothetical protein [Actinoallomurus spadix]MCO5991445.1 hypothetical protein [Actinoallomurus spadix]